jgi:hypothetical protein
MKLYGFWIKKTRHERLGIDETVEVTIQPRFRLYC